MECWGELVAGCGVSRTTPLLFSWETRRPPPTQLADILPSTLLLTIVHQAGAWLERTQSVPQALILSLHLLWSDFKLNPCAYIP